MKVRDIKTILICTIPSVLGVFITLFFYSDMKADVYLFYDHARYLDNIFYDVVNLSIASIFTWYCTKWKRNVFTPFFIVSLLQWILYFTIYKQGASIVTIPILIILLIIYNKK